MNGKFYVYVDNEYEAVLVTSSWVEAEAVVKDLVTFSNSVTLRWFA